jgi:hypothetical protein
MIALSLSTGGCSCGDKNSSSNNANNAFSRQIDGGGSAAAGNAAAGFSCLEDLVRCDGSVARICDGKGGYKRSVNCASKGQRCLNSRFSSTGERLALGCVDCTPGEASCSDGNAQICREDGSGFDAFDCDEMQGLTCEADGCKGACAPPEVTSSYIGCDYYPTVTLNPVWSGFDFAIAVSNASAAPAHVIVSRGDSMVQELTLAVDELQIVKLPWVAGLKGGDQDACQVPPEPGDSRVVKQGAYRVRSDHPVTVYQFSPLQYEIGKAGDTPADCPIGTKCPGGIVAECLSFSNDASLLLPATSLTGDYTVMSWPSRGNTASFFAVTATADGTEVTLKGRGSFRPGGGVDRSGQGVVMLDRGDVLEVLASHGDSSDDASGSLLHASKPVQVIGGHSCADIPDPDTAACDHLEQALFPTQILGKDYFVSYPAAVASKSPHVVRIAAVQPNTKIEFEPALSPAITLGPDDAPFELKVGSYTPGAAGQRGTEMPPVDLHVSADKPISIVQYMQGQTSVPSGSGDPSMALVVPTAQYRSEYVFTASPTYDSNFINVIAPIGTAIMLDDAPLDGDASDIGMGDYHVVRKRLPTGGSGIHRVAGDAAFGLVVYGYGRYTSYMYPGGLDLKRITVVTPE